MLYNKCAQFIAPQISLKKSWHCGCPLYLHQNLRDQVLEYIGSGEKVLSLGGTLLSLDWLELELLAIATHAIGDICHITLKDTALIGHSERLITCIRPQPCSMHGKVQPIYVAVNLQPASVWESYFPGSTSYRYVWMTGWLRMGVWT